MADQIGVLHVLLVHLVVKAHVAVHNGPVPAGGLVGVKGGALISLAARQGGQGGHALLSVELIGHRVGRLEDGVRETRRRSCAKSSAIRTT